MANKSTFTSALSTALSVVITKLKVLATLAKFTDELWATTINDQSNSTNVITKTYTNATYNLNFKKAGNTVYVTGLLKVTGGVTFNTGGILATFTNTEFKPKDSNIFYVNGNELGTGNSIVFFFRGDTPGTITNGRPMTNNTQYSINGFYTTND